jgi:NADH:ubiquinone oxidoreductase subunit E
MTRIELCTDHLDRETREAILDALYEELHVSPGQVTADGDFELDVVQCRGFDPEDSPAMRVDGVLFMRINPRQAVDIIRARRRGR